ncbi:hypothetical protein LguiA_007436 [Lonicera macranthoides]
MEKNCNHPTYSKGSFCLLQRINMQYRGIFVVPDHLVHRNLFSNVPGLLYEVLSLAS